MNGEDKPVCPTCGSTDTIPVVPGKPTEELVERWRRGEIELGGCCRGPDSPDRHCRACGHCWRQ